MKPLKTNYLFIGIVTLILALALWPNFQWPSDDRNQLQQIQARGVLRVSTLNAAPNYYMTDTGPSGLDYELAHRFADYLGVKLEMEPYHNVQSLFKQLDNNDTDLLAAGLIYNPERKEKFRVGPAYYSISQQLVYLQGQTKPKSLNDIKNELKLVSGSASVATLRQLSSKYTGLSWKTTSSESTTDLLKQVSEAKLNYAIADSITVSMMQRVYPQIAAAFDISEEEPVMWYIKRHTYDDSLYSAMLDFYNHIIEDGTMAKLEEKYLGHVGGYDYVDIITFLNAIDTILPDLQPLFQKHTTKIDWRLAAAIAYQESHWNPTATSATGVRGIMMLTRSTAESLGVSDRLDPEQSIRGGLQYLEYLIGKLPESIIEDDKIWFALVAYNMGFAHMLDARALTKMQNGNPDSWVDVKKRLPMLSQKKYYSQTRYGYARGVQAYQFVENIRRYRVSLIGYLQEKENQSALAQKYALQKAEKGQAYPAVPYELMKP